MSPWVVWGWKCRGQPDKKSPTFISKIILLLYFRIKETVEYMLFILRISEKLLADSIPIFLPLHPGGVSVMYLYAQCAVGGKEQQRKVKTIPHPLSSPLPLPPRRQELKVRVHLSPLQQSSDHNTNTDFPPSFFSSESRFLSSLSVLFFGQG